MADRKRDEGTHRTVENTDDTADRIDEGRDAHTTDVDRGDDGRPIAKRKESEATERDDGRTDPASDRSIEPGSPTVEHAAFVLLGIVTTILVVARGFGIV